MFAANKGVWEESVNKNMPADSVYSYQFSGDVNANFRNKERKGG